jgi:hypothetical protein
MEVSLGMFPSPGAEALAYHFLIEEAQEMENTRLQRRS